MVLKNIFSLFLASSIFNSDSISDLSNLDKVLEQRVENQLSKDSNLITSASKYSFNKIERQLQIDQLKETDRRYQPPLKDMYLTSDYGSRTLDDDQEELFHPGLDLFSNASNQVQAIYDGVVVDATDYAWSGQNGGFGNLIIIQQTDGNFVFYGHLEQIDVSPGDQIKKGQAIGIVGSTGNSTGPHLHLEIRLDLEHAGAAYNSINPHQFFDLD